MPIPRLYSQLNGNPITGFNTLGTNQDFTTIKLRQGTQWDWRAYTGTTQTSFGQATSSGATYECYVIGGTWMSPYNSETYYSSPGMPIFYYFDDIRDVDDWHFFLREIPWNVANYNYTAGTKISDIIVEMMQHGWRFQMRDGRAPINPAPLLSYDFTDPNCVNEGDTQVIDLSGNGFDGDLAQNAVLENGQDGSGWNNAPGLSFASGGQWINIPGSLLPSVRNNLTYSVTGWRESNGGNAQYLWDARNCGGTWMLTEYSGYDFNNGGIAQFNDNNNQTRPFNYTHTQGNNGASGYYSGTTQYLNSDGVNNAVTNQTVGIPGGPWGSDFRIGTRYTNSSRWTGAMGGFWIYDKQISSNEAKIVNAHTWNYTFFLEP